MAARTVALPRGCHIPSRRLPASGHGNQSQRLADVTGSESNRTVGDLVLLLG